MPLVSKNHSADVSHTYTRPKNTSPPATGITHPRRPLRVSSTASRPDHLCAVPIHEGALPPGISRYIAKADTSWKSASAMATVASHALTASPLENPARLMEKYCGSCTLPNTPSPTATSAPSATAISTAVADDLAGTTVVGVSASDIAVSVNPDRPDLNAIDIRDALGRQCRRGCGRTVLPPLHARHSPVRVDDPAAADACVVVDIQPGGRLREGRVEIPLLVADRQRAVDRIPFEAPVKAAGLVLVGEADRAVHCASAQPGLDLVAVACVGDRLIALNRD